MVLVERADIVKRSKASSSQHTRESTSESSWRIGLDQSGIMVHHYQENNPSRPFPPSSSSSPPPSKSPLPPSSPPRISQGFSSPAAVSVSTGAPVQQPLGIAPPTFHTSTFKTTGLGAATMTVAAAAAATVTTSLGYPFTHAQWKELETQYMIYKYMVASLPVPPDLLIPIISNLSHHSPHYSPHSFGSGLTLRYGGRTDGEPGRCKRTDGKKWRCSREVAPHQKYCDRHLHRGRPRSRKLVEVQANDGSATAAAIFGNGRAKKTRSNNNTSLVSFSGGGGGGDSLAWRDDRVPLIFPDDDDNSSFLTLESSYKGTRDVDWLMIGDNPCSTSAYNPFPTSSYLGSTYYNKGQGHELFFVSDPPAHSSLTLSMCGTNDDSASWVNLATGGGPLAEALGHGIAIMPSDPSSPNVARDGNNEMDSSLTARTLASLSDSSGASGPCLTASPFTKSEFPVRWSEICINPVASLFFI